MWDARPIVASPITPKVLAHMSYDFLYHAYCLLVHFYVTHTKKNIEHDFASVCDTLTKI
jgi:hypothetical protein